MQRVLKRGVAFLVGVTGFVSLSVAGPARADLALAGSCAEVPLATAYDRAAAAAALQEAREIDPGIGLRLKPLRDRLVHGLQQDG